MKTYWQIQPSRRGGAGFTLLELLIVIAIIAILAALTMGAFKYAQESAARNRTTAALTAIKGGLERYKEKFGEYPEPADPLAKHPTDETLRIGGAKMLYQAITGDGTDAIKLASGAATSPSDGKVDETEMENVIDGSLPPQLIYPPQSTLKSGSYSDPIFLVDGFSRPFQYDKGGSAEAINPTFDIWSFGNYEQGKASKIAYDQATKKDSAKTGAWIKNW